MTNTGGEPDGEFQDEQPHEAREGHVGETPGERVVLDLDSIEREYTGNPLVDRGLDLTIAESREILEKPDHPDYAAAKAADEYMAERFRGMFSEAYGGQFRRIAENLAAVSRPDMKSLAERLFPLPQAVERPPLRELFERVTMSDQLKAELEVANDVAEDEDAWVEAPPTQEQLLLGRMLDALVDLNEQTSEMARVLSDQLELTREERDAADKDRDDARAERDQERRDKDEALKHAKRANIGTWISVAVAIIAVVVGVLVAG